MLDELVAILNQARCPDFVRAISHGDDIVWSHISAAEITWVRRGVSEIEQCAKMKRKEKDYGERERESSLLGPVKNVFLC